MINRLKKSLGFTLTELVVTVAIMGTLAAVSIPSYLETNNKAKTEKTVANMDDLCNTIGQRFNSLASEYGTVKVLPGATEGGPSELVEGINDILAFGAAGSSADSSLTFDDLLPSIPMSPFGDNNYNITLITQSLVTYSQDSDGKMTVRVTKARIIIDDPESDQLYVTYEY